MMAVVMAVTLQAIIPLPPVSGLLSCARETDITLVAAHRAGGFAPGIPENSLAGLREAARLGAAFAEIDLRETSDGVLVLMHDESLDRTTTGQGAVEVHTLDELRTLSLVDQVGRQTRERIPTLGDAFATVKGLGLYLMIDPQSLDPERIARLVNEAGLAARTLLFVYEAQDAGRVQAIAADIGIALPFTDRYEVLNSELDFSMLISWIGYGIPDARTEYFLDGQGVATAMHDLPGEANGRVDYAFIDERHIELLVSNNPEAALDVFGRWDRYCPLN